MIEIKFFKKRADRIKSRLFLRSKYISCYCNIIYTSEKRKQRENVLQLFEQWKVIRMFIVTVKEKKKTYL